MEITEKGCCTYLRVRIVFENSPTPIHSNLADAMRLKYQKILGFLLCCFVCQSMANASIIVSFNRTSGPEAINFSFDVYASANAGTQTIGAYGFTLAIDNSPLNVSATQVAPVNVAAGQSGSNWRGLDNPGASVAGNVVTFRGGGPADFNNPNIDPFNTVIGVGQSTNTLIGTVSFTGIVSTTYTITYDLTTTHRILPGNPVPPNDRGFFLIENPAGPVVSTAVGSTVNPFAITAVPEPSTMALVGLALGGFGLKRLPSRRKRQAKLL